MTDMVKMAKRQAMLDAQAHWMDEVKKAETSTTRSIALVIADAFQQEADKYKEDLVTRTDGGWKDEWIDGHSGDDERRSDGDDERGASFALFEEG